MLSFVVGFSDITPFVVSLLQGNFGIGDRQIVQAVIIASASNNVLKMVYTYVFGSRRTADLVAPGMIGLVVLSMIYAVIGLCAADRGANAPHNPRVRLRYQARRGINEPAGPETQRLGRVLFPAVENFVRKGLTGFRPLAPGFPHN
jgi:hypothetical protein